jgi:hypothetical protein
MCRPLRHLQSFNCCKNLKLDLQNGRNCLSNYYVTILLIKCGTYKTEYNTGTVQYIYIYMYIYCK